MAYQALQGALNTIAGTSGLATDAAANAAISRVAAIEASNGRLLTAGEFTASRNLPILDSVVAPSSQELLLTYFTALRTETVSTITVWAGATAAGATPTIIRYGLYSEASNGDLTLLAATANDTTLLASPNTIYAKALAASTTKTIGQRYAVGVLVVSAAAMATYYGVVRQSSGTIDTLLSTAPRVSGVVGSQADLGIVGSTIANASISVTRRNFIAKLT